ncbi:MAG: alpha-L-fucosidase [Bryobacteraceae bacterium]|nr:alpha-L-fucosidase [Bryobacteraceae bacterium]
MRTAILFALLSAAPLLAQQAPGNRAERLEWFRDQGFGLFIHWSHDSQLGSVISHSMVGADEDYLRRFIYDLPKTFNPRKFNPADWAALAKLAGIKYVVFTAKHHSGFCMYDTRTTKFQIMSTPFKRDITREVLDAFRAQGIAPGLYYSPDDFLWLHENKIPLQRNVPGVQPSANPGLLKYDQQQVRELMTGYGPVDVLFFDGEAEGLKEVAWAAQPDVVVTRGAIQTPEQYIPGVPMDEPWEACITMGTQWQYKPTNDVYKSGGQLISMLIETRAKGGNLLLNVGPKPDGELPIEQEERLREVALWMFVNGESIYGVRPWVVTNEGPFWFTKRKGEDTVYVFVKEHERWKYGEWKDLVLKSVRTTAESKITVLGQSDEVLEYQPKVTPKTTWQQSDAGLKIRAMRAVRLNNDRRWPNPVVLKITHAKPALAPPKVETVSARWAGSTGTATFEGRLETMGGAAAVEVGFEYRSIKGKDIFERDMAWTALPLKRVTAAGAFTVTAPALKANDEYEYRAVVKHPIITLYGSEKKLGTKAP